jgi:iron complex transport system substrate-binding protein
LRRAPVSRFIRGAWNAPTDTLLAMCPSGHRPGKRRVLCHPVKRLTLIAVISLAQCARATVGVHDDFGRAITLASPAARVVSLAPHLTELVYAAGGGGALVGVSDFSDYPPEARALPRVGGSAGIDVEAVLALRPDLVLAWSSSGSARAVERLTELRMPVFRSEPRRIEDIPHTIERLGVLLGRAKAAARAAAKFRVRAARIEARYAGRTKVRVFYQIWDRPLVTIGGEHIIDKVIGLCGGENVFAHLSQLALQIDRESVLRADPQVIIAGQRDGERPAGLDAWRGFPGLSATAHAHLYAIPADLIQRHTPRILDGAERICALLERARAGG